MIKLFSAHIVGLAFCLTIGVTTAYGASLPEGEGREVVQSQCSACHTVSRITQSLGYSREGWLELAATMVDLSADPERRDNIADYLTKHFPPNDHRAPTIVEGDTSIAFKEWVLPTLARPGRSA